MKLAPEGRARATFNLAFITALVSLVIVLVLVVAQVYVRWFVNQNFTFLGGSELEVLTASAFLLTLGLAYLYRAAL